MSNITQEQLDRKYQQYFVECGVHQLLSASETADDGKSQVGYDMNKIKNFMSIQKSNSTDVFTYITQFKHNINHNDIVDLMCHTVKCYPEVLPRVNYTLLKCTQDEINKIKNSTK